VIRKATGTSASTIEEGAQRINQEPNIAAAVMSCKMTAKELVSSVF